MGGVDKGKVVDQAQLAIITKQFNETLGRFAELVAGLDSGRYPAAARDMLIKQAENYLHEMNNLNTYLPLESTEKVIQAHRDFKIMTLTPDQQKFLKLLDNVKQEGRYLLDNKDKITSEKVADLQKMFDEATKLGKKAKDEKQPWEHHPSNAPDARRALNYLKEHLVHYKSDQPNPTSPKR
jgi:hypothetical protein